MTGRRKMDGSMPGRRSLMNEPKPLNGVVGKVVLIGGLAALFVAGAVVYGIMKIPKAIMIPGQTV